MFECYKLWCVYASQAISFTTRLQVYSLSEAALRHISQPAGDARGKVRGSPESVGFILWEP